jgi:hypothetical protein
MYKMNKMKTRLNLGVVATLAACAGILVFSNGCTSTQRLAPIAGTVINANMSASDYEVLGTTEGKSTKTSIACGIVQIIDGNKYRVLWMNFFEDEYAFQHEKHWWEKITSPVSTADRAYYHALAATPDADVVAAKSFVENDSGWPFYSTKEITFTGKALKYKVHP